MDTSRKSGKTSRLNVTSLKLLVTLEFNAEIVNMYLPLVSTTV